MWEPPLFNLSVKKYGGLGLSMATCTGKQLCETAPFNLQKLTLTPESVRTELTQRASVRVHREMAIDVKKCSTYIPSNLLKSN